MRVRLCALLLVLAAGALAQFDPEDAEVVSYYPHVADGGPASQHWTTTLTFANPDPALIASGTVYFYGNSGVPLYLDFGIGPQSSVYFAIPPQGTVQLQSKGTPSNIITGWAMATTTLPVQGVVRISFSANGVPQQGAAEQTTKASTLFRSVATPTTGVAIANVNSTSITVTASALDAKGSAVANAAITLNAMGHAALTVAELFPGLPSSFNGSVLIATTVPGTNCVAWTLSADQGVLAGDPPSGLGWPVSQYERIWKVWRKLVKAAGAAYVEPVPPSMQIDPTTGLINASANAASNQVTVFVNLAELAADSDSELSFLIGHELGHLLEAKLGRTFNVLDLEQDADDWAIALSLEAGYDPYAAAGALGKLFMASTTPGVLATNFDNLQAIVGPNLHGSFSSRLSAILGGIGQVCQNMTYQPLCRQFRTDVHSHLPAPAPLSVSSPAAGSLP